MGGEKGKLLKVCLKFPVCPFGGAFPTGLFSTATPSDFHLAAVGKMQAGFQEALTWQHFFFKIAGHWNV